MNQQDKLIAAITAKHPTLDQRELLAGYVEGMTGIHNAYCLTSEDLQTLAGYIWNKVNRS